MDDGEETDAVEAVVEFSLESRIARSQSSVLAWAGEMVVGGAVSDEEQTGKSEAMVLAGEVVLSKRLVRTLFPPAAGTSHRPMKGTRRTPPVLGGEWNLTRSTTVKTTVWG